MLAAVTRGINQTALHCSFDCEIHRQWLKICARIQVSGGSLPIHFPLLSPETNWRSSSLPNDRAKDVQYVFGARSSHVPEKPRNAEESATNAR